MGPSPARSPWTVGVTVSWRPDFAFYENRIAILRALREARLLRRFVVHEQVVVARLSESRELRVEPTGMTLTDTIANIYEDQDALRALDLAARLIDPVWGRVDLLATYLVPIDGDYTEVRQRACRAIWGEEHVLAATDFAILLDGQGPNPALTYQVEYGLAADVEIPDRIFRLVGRGQGGGPLAPTTAALDRTYPPVALFVDSRWIAQGRGSDADSLMGWIGALFGQVPDLNEKLVDDLHRHVVSNNSQSPQAGARGEVSAK